MKEEEAKRKKYAVIQFKDACTRFMPFAVDDFGHIGDAGWALLEQLRRSIRSREEQGQ